MNEIALIGGMALVTFAVRYPMLALLSKLPMPDALFRALRFVPPAILTAIVVPAVLMPEGTLLFHYRNAHLVAGIIALLVAWRVKNLLLTIVLGMLLFWGWRWLLILLPNGI